MRYPAPATVTMIQGSPRRLRSAETVMRTALVNGSAFSSHARSSSSSALTTPPSAATRTSSTANCFRVSAPAVERSEAEHEFLEFERLREVVVGAELEPGDLVVEPIGSSEHEDRHAAAAGDDALGDLVTGRPGNVPVEHGDVVGVDAQQLQGGVAVAGDVR